MEINFKSNKVNIKKSTKIFSKNAHAHKKAFISSSQYENFPTLKFQHHKNFLSFQSMNMKCQSNVKLEAQFKVMCLCGL